MRLLVTADLHLGRRPRRLPAELAERYACNRAWEDLVETAIQQEVAAVLLAGDVVDEENRFFEALGPLERGVARLQEAGIETIAVAGNHDFEVLPRLARQTTGLRLLGQGGSWERHVLSIDGTPRLQLVGWSFPTRHVHSIPLNGLETLSLDSSLPTIGLLHGDLDNPRSDYGPLSSDALLAGRVSAWVLGHIHKPTTAAEAAQRPILYPGCPQGGDPGPGGAGLRGPWLLDLGDGTPRFEQLATARLRYEDITLSFEQTDDADSLQPRLVQPILDAVDRYQREQPNLESLCVRLHLEGVTAIPEAALREQAAALRENGLEHHDIKIIVHSIRLQTRLPIDLQALQQEPGLLGELARLLVALDADESTWDDSTKQLVTEAEARLEGVENAPAFQGLDSSPAPREEVRENLKQQAWRLLAELHQEESAYA